MKYIIRAVKYFVYIIILLSIIMGILILVKAVPADIDQMFKNGWKSIGQIAILFAAIAAIYPKFGYVKREVMIPGEYGEIRQGVIGYMTDRGYKLESEDGENLTFRLRAVLNKIMRTYEDRLTFTRNLGGFVIEGPNKDIVRVIRGLEYKFRNPDDTDAA